MPRRLLAAAVAGALALVGLAGCREAPTVAAYVGDAQLSTKQVEGMLNEFGADTRDKNAAQIRETIVSLFVSNELSRRLAKEHDIKVPDTDTTQLPSLAGQNDVTNGAAIRLFADAQQAITAIQNLGTPQPPTEADRREIFQGLVNTGRVDPSQYNDYRDQLDSPGVEAALGLRTVLKAALNRYHVTVNPRYQPLSVLVPLGGIGLEVPLDTAPSAVIDQS